jgi:putative transposase
VRHVNRPLTDKELERVRASVARGRPFGDAAWVEKTVHRLRLEHTVRPEGRPRKVTPGRPADRRPRHDA